MKNLFKKKYIWIPCLAVIAAGLVLVFALKGSSGEPDDPSTAVSTAEAASQLCPDAAVPAGPADPAGTAEPGAQTGLSVIDIDDTETAEVIDGGGSWDDEPGPGASSDDPAGTAPVNDPAGTAPADDPSGTSVADDPAGATVDSGADDTAASQGSDESPGDGLDESNVLSDDHEWGPIS